MSDKAPFIAIPVVFGSIVLTVIVSSIYYHKTRAGPFRKAMAALVPIHLKPPENLERDSPAWDEHIRGDVRGDTQHKVQARLAEEGLTGHGDQVWLTYEIRADMSRRFALLAGGHKWELVDASGGSSNSGKKAMVKPSMVPTTVDEERVRCASTPLGSSLGKSGEGNTTMMILMSLVGWTTKSPHDIKAISDEAAAKFGNGVSEGGAALRRDSSHKYFRYLAEGIVGEARRAADWDWLHVATVADRQFGRSGMPYTPPAAVAATWLRRMTAPSPRFLLTATQAAVIDRNAVLFERLAAHKEVDYVTNVMMTDQARQTRRGGATTALMVRKRAAHGVLSEEDEMEMGIVSMTSDDGGSSGCFSGSSDWGAATGTSSSSSDSSGGSSSGSSDSSGGGSSSSSGGGGGGGGD